MRIIDFKTIKEAVKQLTISAIYDLDYDVVGKLEEGMHKEQVKISQIVISEILENAKIARTKRIPMCQDTGVVVVFLEIGNLVHFDFLVEDAINVGVEEAYKEELFRMSIVRHPLDRVNTFTNTPCIIHSKAIMGDKLKITVCPKGAGSENLSQMKMMIPSDGEEGVKKFIIDAVINAGGRVCPPMIVGIGIGGNFETSTKLAKEAVIRPINDKSSDPIARRLEEELLEEINKTNIGPMGIGGKTTCLAVKVNVAPCHIASLPVAINFQCHASRHKEVIL